MLQALVEALPAPIYFIGDLDPIDLVAYASLVVPAGAWTGRVHYLGVSDWWIERCERDLESSPRTLDKVCIRMDEEERDGIERLRRLPIDWDGIVGPRGMALLKSGMKLELEGASNPRIYSCNFCDELLRTLFDTPPALKQGPFTFP